ncbi:MAG: pitrilysin family protein [Acidobacteriota bacterium]
MLRTKTIIVFITSIFVSMVSISAQIETPPAPSAAKVVTVPAVVEKKLANGLTIAVAERKGSPLVTIQLLVKSGASSESADKAGLADLTASMLTKGTKTRSASQIAEDLEFLGGSINSGAGWNNSFVSITVTSDKVEQALAILADVVLNPGFDQKELDLLKSQTLDGLTYNLKQPSFLANFAASKYSFAEHPAGGTPTSIQSITAADVSGFHDKYYRSDGSVLIFAGDITLSKASSVAVRLFGTMKLSSPDIHSDRIRQGSSDNTLLKRILVIDLPNSGQAAVGYYDRLPHIGRQTAAYYPATVMNTVLGGGYSARLNYEIRIKRGLSYGAGSNIGWRFDAGNFGTRAQTKNQSAAEVAELTMAEIKRLTDSSVASDELVPRKSTLTGNFGLGLETTGGLARAISDLYSFGIPASELNTFVSSVNGVTDSQIRDFASKNLLGGDIIIAGDYAVFKDDLAKRFPNMTIDVIKADDLDLSKDNLRK